MKEFKGSEMSEQEDPSESQENVEYKPGDKIRLTPEKIGRLEKGGFIDGFPTTEGEVVFVSGETMSVQFDYMVRMVQAGDVEKIE